MTTPTDCTLLGSLTIWQDWWRKYWSAPQGADVIRYADVGTPIVIWQCDSGGQGEAPSYRLQSTANGGWLCADRTGLPGDGRLYLQFGPRQLVDRTSSLALTTQFNKPLDTPRVLLQAMIQGERWSSSIDQFVPFPVMARLDSNLAGASHDIQGTILTDGAQAPNQVFTHADLAGARLSSVDLSGSNFSQAAFGNAVLSGCNLAGCNMTGASFMGTDFGGSFVDGADFSGADLSALSMSAPWCHRQDGALTNLTNATIDVGALRLDLSRCDLRGAVIGNAKQAGDLSGVDFSGSNLSGLCLRGLDLSGANLTGANLTGCDLTGATLSNAKLDNATATGAIFNRVVMDQTSLAGLLAGGQDGASGAVFNYAYMANVNLSSANLDGVDFSYATLFGNDTSLAGIKSMVGTRFNNAYLAGIDFSNVELLGCGFDGACLVSANFTNANLGASQDGESLTSLVGACLQGADFSSAVLEGANLDNASINPERTSLPISHCTEQGGVSPAWPTDVPATSITADNFRPGTICPNGRYYSKNVADHVSFQQMLTAQAPPTSWSPKGCGSD